MQYAVKQNGNINEIHTYLNQNFVQLKALGQSIDNVYTIYSILPYWVSLMPYSMIT